MPLMEREPIYVPRRIRLVDRPQRSLAWSPIEPIAQTADAVTSLSSWYGRYTEGVGSFVYVVWCELFQDIPRTKDHNPERKYIVALYLLPKREMAYHPEIILMKYYQSNGGLGERDHWVARFEQEGDVLLATEAL